MNRTNILVLNNDKLSQKSMYELLSRNGYKADMADSFKKSLACLEEKFYHLVLADIDSQTDGIELLKVIRKRCYPAEVIVLASYGNLQAAIDSMKMGALDYILKPAEDEKIVFTIEKALSYKPVIGSKPVTLSKLPNKKNMYHGLVGVSQAMNSIYSMLDRISNSSATILLRGESGTGKRMIAKAIHSADKKRRDKPFIELSCGALPREIIESELFGHTKGAFTGAINDRKGRFELADGGTMLLDDIDSFSLDLQVKLLRVLQEKEFERVGDHKTMKVDVRVIVTTNQDLEKAIADKKFREDLYYRLNVISINIPPLRIRKEDLPMLVDHFMKNFSEENDKAIKGISESAMNILTGHSWPGNIRELENIIERAVILDIDGVIDYEDLPEILATVSGANDTMMIPRMVNNTINNVKSLKDAMEEPEKVYILQVLEEAGWNKNKAARKLGLNRTTLYNKLKKYNINAPE